jgi:hypothetical protein
LENRSPRHDLATFIKVAIVAAILITIIKTDIEAEMKYTENVRNGFYTVVTEGGGKGNAGF